MWNYLKSLWHDIFDKFDYMSPVDPKFIKYCYYRYLKRQSKKRWDIQFGWYKKGGWKSHGMLWVLFDSPSSWLSIHFFTKSIGVGYDPNVYDFIWQFDICPLISITDGDR